MEDLTKPLGNERFNQLSKMAYEYLNKVQAKFKDEYNVTWTEDWHYDQYSGELQFSDNGLLKLKILYEEVGSISKVSNTWLWSWANPHIEEKVRTDILEVKNYGLVKNIPLLIKAKWVADEYDGWEMTAIAAYLMNAKGAYRFPLDNTYSFIIFKEVHDLS